MDARSRALMAPLAAPTPAVSRRTALALLAACVALRVVSLVRPCLSDDEATYAVVGRELLAGRALYKDVVDHKPPAIYVVNAVTQALGGTTAGMLLLHALLIVVVWATGLVLARLVRDHGGLATADRDDADATRAPALAALLWIVFTTTLADVDALAANCELFMMLPVVASVAMFLAARARPARLVAAGALVGVAMLFKYQAGIQLPLYAVAWLIGQRRAPARAALGLAALALGVALPLALAIGWLAAHGALADAWFWFRFNFRYIDHGASGGLARSMTRLGFVVIAALPLYLLAARALRELWHERTPARLFVVGWLVASALAVTVGGRFFGHYFHQLTAPLAVLAAPVAATFARAHRRVFVVALAVPAAIFFALGVAHDRVMALYGEPDPDYASVVRWLDDHGRSDDALCIWGNSPVLYFDAARPLGCRFVFANYITGLSPATPTQTDPAVDSSANAVVEAWPMMAADLAARRPTFVIDASPGNVGFYGKYPPAKFPLGKILACDYTPEALVAGMRIHRRRATSTCATARTP